MNEFEELIIKNKKKFNSNEELILTSLLENQEFIINNNLTALAKKCYTSPASVHRIIKKLDFQGFGEFRYFVKNSLIKSAINHQPVSLESYQEKLNSDINLTLSMNQYKIDTFIQLLKKSENTYCYGTGWKQKNVAESFSHDLLYYQKKAFALRNEGDLRILANQLTTKDLVIIISLSGNTESYLDVLELFELNNINVISITCDTPNSLMSFSKVNFMYKDTLEFTGKHWQCMTLNVLMDYLLECYYANVYSFEF